MGTVNRETRTFRKVVCFRDTEYARIAERARECGLPAGRYIREAALGTAPRARRNHLELELVRELSRIGSTLNRLARGAGPDEEAGREAELREVLGEVRALIRRLGAE